jgi:hypothetical protein
MQGARNVEFAHIRIVKLKRKVDMIHPTGSYYTID